MEINMAGVQLLEKKCLEVWVKGVRRGFLSERMGKSFLEDLWSDYTVLLWLVWICWSVVEKQGSKWWWWLLLYSSVLHSRADSLHLHVVLHEPVAFYSVFLSIHQSDVLAALAWLEPHETAAILACSAYTIQPCHFMQSHMCKVYVCLSVTCHLHFWQNDRQNKSPNAASKWKLRSVWIFRILLPLAHHKTLALDSPCNLL